MLNVEFFQELFEPLAIKLGAVVSDDGSREAIMAYEGFLDERFHLGHCDVGDGLGFNPFGEIIHDNEEELLYISRSSGAGCRIHPMLPQRDATILRRNGYENRLRISLVIAIEPGQGYGLH